MTDPARPDETPAIADLPEHLGSVLRREPGRGRAASPAEPDDFRSAMRRVEREVYDLP